MTFSPAHQAVLWKAAGARGVRAAWDGALDHRTADQAEWDAFFELLRAGYLYHVFDETQSMMDQGRYRITDLGRTLLRQ